MAALLGRPGPGAEVVCGGRSLASPPLARSRQAGSDLITLSVAMGSRLGAHARKWSTHMKPRIPFRSLVLCCAAVLSGAENLGIYEANGDIGETPQKGKVEFSGGEYRVTGGGANVWANTDAFHYVWKKMSGDVAISADIRFVGSGAVAHRKAMLMIRQSADPDAAYADAALHGDGLTSLQFRSSAAGITQEVRQEAKSEI